MGLGPLGIEAQGEAGAGIRADDPDFAYGFIGFDTPFGMSTDFDLGFTIKGELYGGMSLREAYEHIVDVVQSSMEAAERIYERLREGIERAYGWIGRVWQKMTEYAGRAYREAVDAIGGLL